MTTEVSVNRDKFECIRNQDDQRLWMYLSTLTSQLGKPQLRATNDVQIAERSKGSTFARVRMPKIVSCIMERSTSC